MSFHDEEEPRLPYPTINVPWNNDMIEEYVIPDEDREEVLKKMYFFDGAPSLDEELYDLHAHKNFIVKDFKVTRERGRNWLVSPYYYEAGGTVIDWMPKDFGKE